MNFRLRVVLVAPRIAANVGNVARSCSAMGAELHLVGPLGFIFDEKKAKRASVGYWNEIKPVLHADSEAFWRDIDRTQSTQFVLAEKDGESIYTDFSYASDLVLIFGNEEEGVDKCFWKSESLPAISSCRIPMLKVRCLNLATSVGVVGYEVIRQWTTAGRGYRIEDQSPSALWI